MQNKPTKRIATGWVVSAIGGVMISLGSAAAADLSPQDRCAIAKLKATSQEAICLADAQIQGIRRELTDRQVDRLQATCTERKDRRFENAEDDEVESACRTIGVAEPDLDLIDHALLLAIETPTSCDPSEEPCDYSTNQQAASSGTATLTNTLVGGPS